MSHLQTVCESRIRVRYAETDAMGVVYYANYFVWMEIGRTDYCKLVGFSYRDMEQNDGNMAVADASCRYISPARYDDEILIRTRIERLSKRLVSFEYYVSNALTGRILAEGRTAHIMVGKDGRVRSMPEQYYCLLSGQTQV
jgi:acyl-CoA thioester hydrolase